jgi:two-component system C4-dicarboxylate transport response regulator DctD
MSDYKIVIVDDDSAMRDSLSDYFTLSGFKVMAYESGLEMFKEISDIGPCVIICDLKMPIINGIEVLKKLKSIVNPVPLIMLTAHGNIQTAVEAIQNGAYDFLEKPFNPDDLKKMVGQAFVNTKSQENINIEEQLHKLIPGNSEILKVLRKNVLNYSNNNNNYLIIGEKGVGKDLIAKALHNCSSIKNKPFIHINCSMATEELFEKLFVGEYGAFSTVQGGTVFLDGLDSLPVESGRELFKTIEKNVLSLQYKFLVDEQIPRITCSIRNKPTDQFNKTNIGRICSMIGKIIITVLPLRDHKEDIFELFNLYLAQSSNQYQTSIPVLSEEDIITLSSYSWPGNQHQLKQIAERFVLLSRTINVSISYLLEVSPQEMIDITNKSNVNLRTLLINFECQLITQAMIECSGNISQVCALLKTPRRTLNEKLLKHDLSREMFLRP